MRTSITTLLLNTLLISLIGFTSCSTEDVTADIKREITVEEQMNLARIMSETAMNDANNRIVPASASPEIYEYLNAALSTVSSSFLLEDGQFFEWEIFLVDDASINAYTIPGGKIYITKGMLSFLKAENELLSIIGHEMAYAEKGLALDYLVNKYGDDAVLNVVGGFHEKAEDMFYALKNARYAAAEIKTADEFSAMVLCPFTYRNGLVDIISSENSFEWLETKFNYEGRADFINSLAPRLCCHGEETYEERFVEVMDAHLEAVSFDSNS